MFTSQQINLNNNQYNLEQTFQQVCQYKIFEVNLKRALLLNNISLLKQVCLINSKWFENWKKISCYEAIKDDLDMGISIQENYKRNKVNYLKIMKNLEFNEILDINIKNNSIISGFDNLKGKITINPESDFDIISPELWESFVPSNSNNVNNGSTINVNVEYLTKFAFMIELNKNANYIIYWNINEQQVEKIVLKFSDEGQKFLVFENLKNLGINNFVACYLDDLADKKDFSNNNFSFKCINKTRNKKIVIKTISNSNGNYYNNNFNNNNFNYNNFNNNFNNNFDDNNFNYNNFNNNVLLPVGLNNIGFTCYMNSTLQCLVHVQKLSNYFLKNRNQINEQNQILSFAYMKVVENLLRKTPNSQYIQSYSPHEFQGIASINPLFIGAGDSIDLLNHFLQTIHTEQNMKDDEYILSKYVVNNNNNNKKFQILNNTIINFVSQNNSIITNTFYIIEKTKIKCNNCNQTQYGFQFSYYIILPLEEIRIYKLNHLGLNQSSVTLKEGLEFYRRECNLVGENRIQCNLCGMYSNGTQSSSFYSLPKIFIINLNRGHGNIYNVGIVFPEKINLTNFAESTIDNNSNYKLIGVITHLGPSGDAGHFIAFCFVQDKDRWYKFNDSIVTESNFMEVSNTGDSYILFYERQ